MVTPSPYAQISVTIRGNLIATIIFRHPLLHKLEFATHTPSKRGKSAKRQINGDERSSVEQHAAMTWAQRLKRVFNIDITICEECGGAVKVIASIEDPVVIKQILAHLQRKAVSKEFNPLPESRAPPQIGLFG